jgi:hypothetical protein
MMAQWRCLVLRSLSLRGNGAIYCTMSKISLIKRNFSSSPRRSLMGLSGFTETQLTVREAIMKLCSNFPDVRSLGS